jgi:hypothetical protein
MVWSSFLICIWGLAEHNEGKTHMHVQWDQASTINKSEVCESHHMHSAVMCKGKGEDVPVPAMTAYWGGTYMFIHS